MSRPAPVVVHATGPLCGLELHVAPISGSRLVDDYQVGAPTLAPFFTGHPYDILAYRRKAAEIDARLTPSERARLAPALRATTPRAAERLRAVLDGRGYVVTTGQQAGLFGGPLYTVYKLLSAVRLAQALERALGKTVVPLFWVAADDHDFAEVDHTFTVDAEHALQRIGLRAPADNTQPVPMAEQLLGPDVLEALDAFASTLPAGAFADEAMARLRSHYRPGRSVADAFETTIADLGAGFDIVVVSSAHPSLKEAAAPVLLHELAHQAEHAALLERTTAALATAGYAAQVPIAPDVSNVFHHAQGRDRLVREDGTWHHRRSRTRIPDAVVREQLAADPGMFSPNVLLRPVVESALFPTLAYVAGPSELAYFAQIGCLFRAHGIEPPVVFPRHSLALVNEKVRHALDRHALDVSAFARPTHELVSAAVRGELPADVVAALEALGDGIAHGFDGLAAAALPIDVTLAGPVDAARRNALERLAEVEKRIVARMRDRDGITQRQIERAAVWLRPDDAAQERRLNLFGWLGRYGPELLPALLEALPITLGTPAPAWDGLHCE